MQFPDYLEEITLTRFPVEPFFCELRMKCLPLLQETSLSLKNLWLRV